MNEPEVIIELGAEGGSITLSGFRTERGWCFSRELIDWTPELIDEERIQHTSAIVASWEAALKLLDKYPWPLAEAPPRGSRFGTPLVLSRVHWVRPEVVVEVSYLTWTRGLAAASGRVPGRAGGQASGGGAA